MGTLPPLSLGKRDIDSDSDEEIIAFSQYYDLQGMPESADIEVSLYKPRPSRIDLSRLRRRLPSGIATYQAYTAFVPEDDVDGYLECLVTGREIRSCGLFRRYQPRDSSKKINELLEHAVNHLLALCHLNPVLLSNLNSDAIEGGMNAGSADILAATPDGEPLLVGCTMAMVDDRKRGMLLSGRKAICTRFQWQEDRVKLLLVSGKPDTASSSQEVHEIGASELQRLWEFIKRGDIGGAQALLLARPQADAVVY
jgi:hypothetical protein